METQYIIKSKKAHGRAATREPYDTVDKTEDMNTTKETVQARTYGGTGIHTRKELQRIYKRYKETLLRISDVHCTVTKTQCT